MRSIRGEQGQQLMALHIQQKLRWLGIRQKDSQVASIESFATAMGVAAIYGVDSAG